MSPFFGSLLLAAFAIGNQAGAATRFTYENPVIAGDYPDPSVIRVGKDYWATATSSEWGPQFPLLHSNDLINWTNVGPVFAERPKWAVGNFWAPEIAQFNKRFYIYYVGRKEGGPLAVAVATADKPEGPYQDHGFLVAQAPGSIDPVPVEDAQGNRYLIWKEDGNSRKIPAILWIQKLSADGLKLEGEMKEILRNDTPWEGAVVEGPFVVRQHGWYYLFYSGSGCCGSGCSYALGVARAKTLLGPWEKNPENPILAGNSDWKCPGHGSIVDDEKGRHWLMYHAYATKGFVFTGREALLDEVQFPKEGWPTINQGKGPSTKSPSPYHVAQRKAELKFADEFSGEKLLPGWNWPVSDHPNLKIADGNLVVSTPGKEHDPLQAIVARSITTPDFTATTAIKTASLKAGQYAGLAAVGDRANATGIMLGDGKVELWTRAGGKQVTVAEAEAPKNGEAIYFQLIAHDGQQYQFAFSPDGHQWTSVGGNTSGRNLPPWDRAMRVALTSGGATPEQAAFDFLRIVPAESSK